MVEHHSDEISPSQYYSINKSSIDIAVYVLGDIDKYIIGIVRIVFVFGIS